MQDYNLLGAGMYNGQFGVFDLRKGGSMTEVSPIEQSHRWPHPQFMPACAPPTHAWFCLHCGQHYQDSALNPAVTRQPVVSAWCWRLQ